MKKLAAVLGVVVSMAGLTAAAEDPVERVVSDACFVDYWSDAPQLWCSIMVSAPDLSSSVRLAAGIDPSVSPDGSKVALSGGPQRDDIVVVSLLDGAESNLTNDPAVDISPAWSPDGSKIAFASDRTGTSQLFVMNADGSGVTQLTHGAGPAGRPAWSPDGSRIAFDCHLASDNSDICSIASDGTDLVRLTDAPGWDVAAAWSPDGTRIAFLTQSGWRTVAATMNADGSGVSVLGSGISASALAWSQDGARLAIASPPGACNADGQLCYDALRVFTASGTDRGFIGGGSNPTWARIAMTPNPIARFTATCAALDCTFDAYPSWDLGSPLTGFTWDFGDGTTGSGLTVSHSFAEPGTRAVTLTIQDDAGLTGTRTQPVEVAANLPPVAAFTAACSGLTCDFNGVGSSDHEGWVETFTWDFGDGTSGVGPLSRHVFASAGNFTVTLTATDNLGASGTRSEVVRAGNAPPIASFTASCSGFTCSFDATASSDSDGTVVSYLWDFGDGTTASGPTSTHSYRAGQYSPLLTVTDDGGATGTRSQLVTAVNASPVASFTVSCTALTCQFDASASSDTDGTVDHFGWNFGDGTRVPGPIATHTYAGAGQFTVILTITDNGGASGTRVQTITVGDAAPVAVFTASCASLTCSFNASASSDPDGTIASYAWAFGDGTSGTGSAPTHAYAAAGIFTVTLTVTDNLGATGTKTQTVTTTNAPPVASFASSCTGLTCSFNASGSSDSDGTIASYAWAFGDGTTGTGATPTHAYAGVGSFTVTLTVTDNLGATATKSQGVTATNAPPVASFTSSCSGVTCSFNASGSSDSDGTIASYAWAFGDGTNGTSTASTHAYAGAGTFTVTLTVTDNLGATGTRSQAVTATNAPPVASFTSSCTGLTCSFNASGSSDSDGTIASYAWTFGDGTIGTGAAPTHTYAGAGTFTVGLTVTDNGGATGTRTATVTLVQSHVGDLDGTASTQSGTWKAVVTVTLHTNTHALLSGATVSGSWTGGTTASCTTDGTGRCAVSRSSIPGGTHTVTFTVTGVTHASAVYKAAANHDADGDSNGTAIVVSKR
jgi:PKD repeat protein